MYMQGIRDNNKSNLFSLISLIRLAETPTRTKQIKDNIKGFITTKLQSLYHLLLYNLYLSLQIHQ